MQRLSFVPELHHLTPAPYTAAAGLGPLTPWPPPLPPFRGYLEDMPRNLLGYAGAVAVFCGAL